MQKGSPIPILHLITTLNIGGAEMMLFKLLSSMNKGLFQNFVVSLTDIGPVGQKIVSQGTPVYCLSMPRGRLTIRGLIKLWRLLKAIHPIIIQTWLYHADLLGIIFGKLAGSRKICWNIRGSYHDLDMYNSSTKWTIRICSLFSRAPDVVIANSHEGRRFHLDLGYKARRWDVIPNGFDLDNFKPDQLAKPKLLTELGLTNYLRDENGRSNRTDESFPILIGLVARYDPMKDHATFIRAASYLLQRDKNVHFVMVGTDVEQENGLITKYIPPAWKNRFHLLGERDDVAAITAALDIATCSSYGEGFPNIVCEAMACEVPCVVTDVGDSATIVGMTGRVVPPRDPKALAEAWEQMIEIGQEERRRLGVAARRRVQVHFELSRIAEKYEDLYSSLVQ